MWCFATLVSFRPFPAREPSSCSVPAKVFAIAWHQGARGAVASRKIDWEKACKKGKEAASRAAPEYRAAYAVHSAALPRAATPALPAPPDPTPAGAPMAPGPTRCVQQLTWTPSVIVMEPRASERIMSMALHSATFAVRDGYPTPGSQQPHPEPVVPSRPEEASAKGASEAAALPTTTLAETGGIRDARAPAVRQVTANSGKSAVSGSACDALT